MVLLLSIAMAAAAARRNEGPASIGIRGLGKEICNETHKDTREEAEEKGRR